MKMDFLTKQVQVIKRRADIKTVMYQILEGANNIKSEQLVDIQNYDVSELGKDALTLELESFIDCVQNHKKPIVDGEAGTRALEIATMIINQIQTQNSKINL